MCQSPNGLPKTGGSVRSIGWGAPKRDATSEAAGDTHGVARSEPVVNEPPGDRAITGDGRTGHEAATPPSTRCAEGGTSFLVQFGATCETFGRVGATPRGNCPAKASQVGDVLPAATGVAASGSAGRRFLTIDRENGAETTRSANGVPVRGNSAGGRSASAIVSAPHADLASNSATNGGIGVWAGVVADAGSVLTGESGVASDAGGGPPLAGADRVLSGGDGATGAANGETCIERRVSDWTKVGGVPGATERAAEAGSGGLKSNPVHGEVYGASPVDRMSVASAVRRGGTASRSGCQIARRSGASVPREITGVSAPRAWTTSEIPTACSAPKAVLARSVGGRFLSATRSASPNAVPRVSGRVVIGIAAGGVERLDGNQGTTVTPTVPRRGQTTGTVPGAAASGPPTTGETAVRGARQTEETGDIHRRNGPRSGPPSADEPRPDETPRPDTSGSGASWAIQGCSRMGKGGEG